MDYESLLAIRRRLIHTFNMLIISSIEFWNMQHFTSISLPVLAAYGSLLHEFFEDGEYEEYKNGIKKVLMKMQKAKSREEELEYYRDLLELYEKIFAVAARIEVPETEIDEYELEEELASLAAQAIGDDSNTQEEDP